MVRLETATVSISKTPKNAKNGKGYVRKKSTFSPILNFSKSSKLQFKNIVIN